MADQQRTLWTLMGITAGVAAGIWLWRRGAERWEKAPDEPVLVEADAAVRVARALDRDIELASRRLRVDRISDGVIEISGAVADREQQDRAVAMAHNEPGIHTVVNRLVVETEEQRLAERRDRAGEHTVRHTGMGVGMGTRRQSPDTDPDRPSDRQKMVERELEVRNLEADLEPEPEEREEPGSGP